MKKLFIYAGIIITLFSCENVNSTFDPGGELPKPPVQDTVIQPEIPDVPELPEIPEEEDTVKEKPVNYDIKEVVLDSDEDETRTIRNALESTPDGTKNKPSVIHFKTKDSIKTHGMLPEDLERRYGRYLIGDVGAGKIFKLENRNNLVLVGGKFYNPTPTFTKETRPDRSHHNVSENIFLQFYGSQNISVIGTEFTSHHTEVREATGYPSFHGSEEFEHAFEAVASKNIYLEGVHVKNIPGDLMYFRREVLPRNSYITLIDCTVDVNGRQGVAWGDGEYIYIDNLTVTASGRGGIDIETVREQYEGSNIIVKNSYFNTWLLPFPIGGLGTVENVLIENNTVETNSHITAIVGDRQSVVRRNIIFRGNKAVRHFGSPRGYYLIQGAENILIEEEKTKISSVRSGIIAEVINSRNVVIRNNDWNGKAKYIKVIDTPLDEIKVYGNDTNLKFIVYSFEMPFKEAPNIYEFKKTMGPSEAYDKWHKENREWKEYMAERNKTASYEIIERPEYDVEKYGEPDVPEDPDFKPYMGIREFNKSLQKIIDDLNIKL